MLGSAHEVQRFHRYITSPHSKAHTFHMVWEPSGSAKRPALVSIIQWNLCASLTKAVLMCVQGCR